MKNNKELLNRMYIGLYKDFFYIFSDTYLFDFILKMISEEKLKLRIEIPNFKFIL